MLCYKFSEDHHLQKHNIYNQNVYLDHYLWIHIKDNHNNNYLWLLKKDEIEGCITLYDLFVKLCLPNKAKDAIKNKN